MEDNKLTLEEYMEFIRLHSYRDKKYRLHNGIQEIAVSFLDKNSFEIELPDNHPYTVSGNNIDGFILTEWR